jgi:hypothetical protein
MARREDYLDLSAGGGLLNAIIRQSLWEADIALGKLKDPQDAEAMRHLRAHLKTSSRRLIEVLSKIPPSEARVIERLAAQLVRDTKLIGQLHPIPTPNARERLRGEVPARARKARAVTPDNTAIAQACAGPFIEQLEKLPDDWDGRRGSGSWTMAGRLMQKINPNLRPNLQLSQRAIDHRFKKFVKDHH